MVTQAQRLVHCTPSHSTRCSTSAGPSGTRSIWATRTEGVPQSTVRNSASSNVWDDDERAAQAGPTTLFRSTSRPAAAARTRPRPCTSSPRCRTRRASSCPDPTPAPPVPASPPTSRSSRTTTRRRRWRRARPRRLVPAVGTRVTTRVAGRRVRPMDPCPRPPVSEPSSSAALLRPTFAARRTEGARPAPGSRQVAGRSSPPVPVDGGLRSERRDGVAVRLVVSSARRRRRRRPRSRWPLWPLASVGQVAHEQGAERRRGRRRRRRPGCRGRS